MALNGFEEEREENCLQNIMLWSLARYASLLECLPCPTLNLVAQVEQLVSL